ncbi:Pvc16 family protein [Streptomyces sp. NPDC055013]
MSNALAIAHVTQALSLLLASNVGSEFDEAVKVEPRKPPAEAPDHPTINVFLYQVSPNTSMRNNDLPTRASDGTLVKRPAAALDLHYLISAYGDETTLVGQRLIGSVVRTLHEIPILPKDVIEETGHLPHLVGSDLAEAAQRVRFTPTAMDVDETSKLWGMLHQTPYSLSVVYQAALVFIDGRQTPVPAKPVERTDVRVLPLGAPGAPVPPVVESRTEAPSTVGEQAPVDEVTSAETGLPVSAAAKKTTKAPAKTVAKAPARTRKTARASKPPQPEPRKGTEG